MWSFYPYSSGLLQLQDCPSNSEVILKDQGTITWCQLKQKKTKQKTTKNILSSIFVNKGSGDVLLTYDPKSLLPEPMLTYHQWCTTASTLGYFQSYAEDINHKIKLKITYLKFKPYLLQDNDLTLLGLKMDYSGQIWTMSSGLFY